MKKINIVIPVHNEQENIKIIFEKINDLNIKNYNLEFIFVDDGSNDNSLVIIKELANKFKSIKYISFSRNFGHQIALTSGLENATGDAIIMMDADMQHPVQEIPKMIQKFEMQYDIVQMVKSNQGKRNYLIKLFSYIFYSLFRKFSEINLSNNVSDFRLITNKVNIELKKIKDKERFIRGLVQWVGFKYTELEYQPNERKFGKSKYNFLKLIKLASFGIFSFSTIPLKLSLFVGVCLSILSFVYGFISIFKKLTNPVNIPIGYTDLIVFITFLGGIQLIFLGLIGLYISKIFDQVRDRPLYIISEKNFD
ncbi:MAG: glycosyltransferase [Pelagibacteraceae bacterium]|nr:glycosyltransferase [Pelagibacteraceae bacterium]